MHRAEKGGSKKKPPNPEPLKPKISVCKPPNPKFLNPIPFPQGPHHLQRCLDSLAKAEGSTGSRLFAVKGFGFRVFVDLHKDVLVVFAICPTLF